VQTLTVALAQIAPRLGLLDENVARHHELIVEAHGKGAGLIVFPELGLTGYLLQDLAAEVAMRLDDPRLAGLAEASAGMSAVVSFVEESADHRLFIAAALLERGRARTDRDRVRRSAGGNPAGDRRGRRSAGVALRRVEQVEHSPVGKLERGARGGVHVPAEHHQALLRDARGQLRPAADVLGMTTYEDLVDATLPSGQVPLVVPQPPRATRRRPTPLSRAPRSASPRTSISRGFMWPRSRRAAASPIGMPFAAR